MLRAPMHRRFGKSCEHAFKSDNPPAAMPNRTEAVQTALTAVDSLCSATKEAIKLASVSQIYAARLKISRRRGRHARATAPA
jgi:hypothetical protein